MPPSGQTIFECGKFSLPRLLCIGRDHRQPRMTWMKTVQNDLDTHGLSWTEAVDLAQNRPPWNQWRYALVVVQAGEEKVLMYQRSAPKIKVTISLSVQLFKHYLFSVSISASCLL